MKNKILALISIITLLALGSCGEDFLYKAPKGSLDQTALANANGIELLVTNTYANLTEQAWGASIFNWTLSGMYGGDANKGSDNSDQSVLNEMEIYSTSATNSYLNDKWSWIYRGVKRANIALQTMDMCEDLDPSVAAIRKGELYFLRSMFYFEGLRVFGGYIPYFNETELENDPKIHNDRDIYSDVLADVDVAINNLPETPSEVGRVYKWAAKALKAKIYMMQGNMSAAKPLLEDVVNNGKTATGKKYALADAITDNWDSFKDNTSPESIWEVQFSADGNNNGNSGLALCYPHNTGPGGCCGFYQPSFDLANSYQVDDNGLPYLNNEYRTKPTVDIINENVGGKLPDGSDDNRISTVNTAVTVDPRIDIALGRFEVPYKDWGLPDRPWVRDVANGGIYMPKKHVYSKAESDAGLARAGMYDGWAPGSAMNVQYLSVRDAMLQLAECYADEGNLSGAMELVNKIRERAGKPANQVAGSPAKYKVSTYPSSHAAFTDKATCIKAVRFERKLELGMEGERGFDLFRWGGDYMSQELRGYVDYEKNYIGKFNGAATLNPAKTMFPVPQNQIDAMGNDENGQPYLVQPAPWK
ncbi:MAG: RagB/SusD family nutrient uptake outer membrane protein [Tannerella sp.]|jgi:hypothetical protein|nr:RagB/SusD family nutrient uptake outer membrane protein [Tannerella sp.]